MKKTIISLVFVFAKFVLLAQTNIGFSESEITLITQSGNLYGTITIPKSIVTSPIVLIIPGSGSPDRDGNCIPIGLHSNNLKIVIGKSCRKRNLNFTVRQTRCREK